jgi:hypothetical protein
MDRPTFLLSFRHSPVYEVGAYLLVLLTNPGEWTAQSDDLHASLCARALWSGFLANREDTTPITVKPQYVFREIKLFNRHSHSIVKRLAESRGSPHDDPVSATGGTGSLAEAPIRHQATIGQPNGGVRPGRRRSERRQQYEAAVLGAASEAIGLALKSPNHWRKAGRRAGPRSR